MHVYCCKLLSIISVIFFILVDDNVGFAPVRRPLLVPPALRLLVFIIQLMIWLIRLTVILIIVVVLIRSGREGNFAHLLRRTATNFTTRSLFLNELLGGARVMATAPMRRLFFNEPVVPPAILPTIAVLFLVLFILFVVVKTIIST